MSLVLHCGGQAITRDQLAQLPVPNALGARHKVRPFIDDVNLVTESLSNRGLSIKQEGFGVVTDNQTKLPTRYFGLLELTTQKQDFGVMVGLRGSYNQTLPRGLALGSRVFVCDNLAFSGEVQIKTRQTTFIDKRISSLFERALDRVEQLIELQEQRFERFRNTCLTVNDARFLIIEMLRQGVITGAQVQYVVNEFERPTYDAHKADGATVWTLHNAVTEVAKGQNLVTHQQRTLRMTELLDDWSEAQLALAA
jgi:hypothetical protein